MEAVERLRHDVVATLDDAKRAELGQYMTPGPIAELMASMVGLAEREEVRILEPGAGVGSLVYALVSSLAARTNPPARITVDAYEIAPELIGALRETMERCRLICQECDIDFAFHILNDDFIRRAVEDLRSAREDLFTEGAPDAEYDVVITNPPYHKLNTDSAHRRLLREVGIETSNLYSAFVALGVLLLKSSGELVAITPRSFCNGRYFRPFREFLLSAVNIDRVHLFGSRKEAFKDDQVLQENIIFHAVVDSAVEGVLITSGGGTASIDSERTIQREQLVWPGDPQSFFHIVPDEEEQAISDAIRAFRATLDDLSISVSTGRVVDFRVADSLLKEPKAGAAPLVYPTHFNGGVVAWPKLGKKPNALILDSMTRDQTVPSGYYVLVKRFSSRKSAGG